MNETQVIESLSKLGFSEGCIVETILVSLNLDGSPNPAPMGVTRQGGSLVVTPFKTSQTYANLKRGGSISINLTNNPLLFLATSFKDEIDEQPVTKELVLEDADAVIKAEIVGQVRDLELKATFKLLPRDIGIKIPRPHVYSRGRAEAIEAIVHATRIQVFQGENRDEKVQDLVEQVKDCIATINKVSTEGSAEAKVASKIESLIKKWGVEW